MGRRVVRTGANFTVEFDTAGGGAYYAAYLGAEKGPFPNEEAALRHIQARLQTAPGQTMDEITQAEDRALLEADQREAAGTLGSDAQRAAEAAARAEDEEEIKGLREDQAKRAATERAQLLVRQYELSKEEAIRVVNYESQGVALDDAVGYVKARRPAKNADPEGGDA